MTTRNKQRVILTFSGDLNCSKNKPFAKFRKPRFWILALNAKFGYSIRMETTYSHNDRIKQLEGLLESLESLCRHLKSSELFPEMLNVYISCKLDVASLLKTSFSQSELSKLSRDIPDLYYRHKEWMPPLDQSHGKLKEPDWFVELEAFLEPVLKKARLLRELGCY